MILFVSLLLLAATVAALGEPKVIGGVEVNIEDYPYQISIEHNGGHNCGGSILSSTRILTAAHCTQGYDITKLRIRAGSSIREQGGQVVSLKRKYEHPQYDVATIHNDIAVVILSTPLAFGVGVQPISLMAEHEDVPIGTIANLTGWGVTENGSLADHLLKAEVPRLSESDCSFLLDPTTTACFGGAGGSPCSADSGGPIAVSGIQVGVVSYGLVPCSGDNGGVFAMVSEYRNFIDNETPDE